MVDHRLKPTAMMALFLVTNLHCSPGASTGHVPSSGGNTPPDHDATDGIPLLTTACPAQFPKEVFRDDFTATTLDTSRWSIAKQNSGDGGSFTQLTKMLPANVRIEDGRLKLSSQRHCDDPYPNRTPTHPLKCPDTNYYSGAWIKTSSGYAGGHGLMIFFAKMPTPVPGMFPALWARNTQTGTYYGELDLIELWWDTDSKGLASDPNRFSVTTLVGPGAEFHTRDNWMPAVANLTSQFHIWETEWNVNANPPEVTYYYRDHLGGERILLRTVTATTPGLNGKITDADFATMLSAPFRAYVDFAVTPDNSYHVSPDMADHYDPEDLEVESVLICAP